MLCKTIYNTLYGGYVECARAVSFSGGGDSSK